MRITHEADYAIRIMYCLAERNQTISAKQISDDSGVPSRFALKILRRLTQAGLTESFKGVSGGYQLARAADHISLGEIIEVIDGPIEINHCLSSEFDCSRVQQKNECTFHRLFSAINQDIRSKLYDLPLSQFVPEKNQA
ncbi:RrF2 family transcriptional regulator [Butyricicoccus intestinisimiae]|uniref:Rrf2 family transcriptional regulator n=1 Tax=Butyricicoccus intestinisimiae TaxID=2841509 RepID=A0ABS6ESC2_9FIRM|nr:Rrf2 family transcriptional regulator [Butyricicoccus intestinisimiae]MBU5490408.1 Rrf2 family transcriptional regulator [Butyricicoccus intestinisimiae]MEE0325417.1 Rrf2 family transcriptional regulator [Butyricicoccus sp.]